MNCPECGEKTKCLETRIYEEPTHGFEYIERYRECLECLERFQSIEVPVDVWWRMTQKD